MRCKQLIMTQLALMKCQRSKLMPLRRETSATSFIMNGGIVESRRGETLDLIIQGESFKARDYIWL